MNIQERQKLEHSMKAQLNLTYEEFDELLDVVDQKDTALEEKDERIDSLEERVAELESQEAPA